jgi:uncharacterized membrane protein YjfL (UPF0719 family)
MEPWDWNHLTWDLMKVVIYTFLGLGCFAITYLIVDKVTPFSLRKELNEDKNVALAIVLGSVFIGVALILAGAIRG